MGRLSPTSSLKTSSGTDPGENFKGPEDLSDVLGLQGEIPRTPRSPRGGLTAPKPIGRSPLGIEIGKSEGGGLNVTGSLPLGGPISGRGGINIGKDGNIKGGSIGLGIGLGPLGASIDVGTDADEEGRGGCYQYVTVTIGLFSHSFGRNVCDPKPPKPPKPPTPSLPPDPGEGIKIPETDQLMYVPIIFRRTDYDSYGRILTWHEFRYSISDKETEEMVTNTNLPFKLSASQWNSYEGKETGGDFTTEKGSRVYQGIFRTADNDRDPRWYSGDNFKEPIAAMGFRSWRNGSLAGFLDTGVNINFFLKAFEQYENAYLASPNVFLLNSAYSLSIKPVDYILVGPQELPPPTPYLPPSNPPPRKKMDDKCCKAIIALLLMQHKHLGISPSSGMGLLNQVGVNQKGETFVGEQMAFPFEIPKKWLDPLAKQEEKILVKNLSELLFVMGSQSERLERVLGTKEFIKDSKGKLRQSEGNLLSWLSGENPDFAYPDPNDFWLNSDDGIINEKQLEIRSIADGLRYQIEAFNRLERILPIAELKDSSIPARWIYPNGKGQLRVGNLIHLCEYMIRKSDKDMGYWPQKITIKAANPAIKDDEPITSDVHSQADMLRVILQQILDIEGDGDMGSNYDLRRTYLDIMAFQMIAKSTKYLEAITDYLGFDITEEVSKIPIPFDPFAGQDRSVIEQWWIKYGFGQAKTNFPAKNTESEIEELSGKLLQNSELEVNTIKFGSVDEKKDPKTLKEALIEILKHSSASAAAVTEVATESALDRVVDAAGIAQKLTSFLMRRDIREALGIGDLDNWIASAEQGYTDNLGTESLRFPESNSAEPYGRPATQNPVIREIDTKEDKAD